MAYTAHTWQTGEVITADLLNALEEAVAALSAEVDGIEGGGVASVSVTMLEAGSEATASLEGGVLKLGIPRGADGLSVTAGQGEPSGEAEVGTIYIDADTGNVYEYRDGE